MSGIDWPALMRAGIGLRGLRPAEFWALTPAELALVLGPAAPAPLGRGRLADMIAAYPDEDGGRHG
jgi:uncharacterized phage protein (TIGR02216 family)